MRGVRALIRPQRDLSCVNGSVLAEPRYDVEADGVAHTVAHKGLLTGAVEAHAAPADLRGAPRAKRLIQRVLLVAEAAADIGLDNLNVTPWAAERLPDDAADNVRDLCGGHDHQTPVLLVGVAAVVLDVAVLHRRCLVPALDLDEARFLNGPLIVALADVGVL